AQHVTPYAADVLLRCTPWSTGDGVTIGMAVGGAASGGMDEIFGRAMPATVVGEHEFVALAQLYAHHAEIVGSDGDRFVTRTRSQNDVTQWLARRPRARG